MNKNEICTEDNLGWRVHTGNLIKEIANNPNCAIMKIPLHIFRALLVKVANRVADIKDPQLIELMTRLCMYEFCDPYSENYDEKRVNKILGH